METIADVLRRHPSYDPRKGVYDNEPSLEEIYAVNSAGFFELVGLGLLTDTVVNGVVTKSKEEKWRELCEHYGHSGPLTPEDEARMVEVNYQRLNGRMVRAGVPAAYVGVATDKRYAELLSSGNGLFITGEVNVGKTTLACSVLKGWLTDNQYGDPLFVTAPELVSRLTSTYGTGETQESVMHHHVSCPLLVLDDLGKEGVSTRNAALMWRVINDRSSDGLPTLITSQLTPDGYAALFSAEDAASLMARFQRSYRLVRL